MKTTILIDKTTADRVMRVGEKLGHTSMSGTAEFLLRNSCGMIEKHGVDAFISRQRICIEDTSDSTVRE